MQISFALKNHRQLLIGGLMILFCLSTNAQITLEKDINQDAADSDIMNSHHYDGFIYFEANDGDFGNELWSWNLANDEMKRLTDIKPLEENSNPYGIFAYQGKVYFSTSTNFYAYDLETENLSTASSLYGLAIDDVGNSIVFDGKLVLSASVSGTGTELIVLDGTDFSYQIIDINLGSSNSSPNNFTEYQNELYFSASGVDGPSLWKWNPSMDMAEQIVNNDESPSGGNIRKLIVHEDVIYYPAFLQGNGEELFYHDLSTGEGGLLVDFFFGNGSSNPAIIGARDNELYFLGRSSAVNRSLQVLNTESLEIETFLLNEDEDQQAYNGIIHENSIYINGLTTQYDRDIWKFDLDQKAFTLVHDFLDLPLQFLGEMQIIDDRLICTSRTELAGLEWSSYDLENKILTAPVFDLNPKSEGSDPMQFCAHQDKLYFEAFDFKTGSELFVYNPATGQTSITLDQLEGSSGSKPSYMTSYGSKMYLSGIALGAGEELLSYDPSDNTIDLLADIYASTASSQPFYFMPIDGKVYIEANSNIEGREIFAWDTLTNELSLAYESEPGQDDGSKGDMWAFDNKIYFADYDEDIFYEFNPISNEIKDFSQVAGESVGTDQYVNGITENELYFISRNDENKSTQKLWNKTTNTLTTFDNPSTFNISSGETALFNDILYLVGQFASGGSQLWKLDPDSGFTALTDFTKFNPRYPTAFNGQIYFSAEDEEFGNELWVYDIEQDSAFIFADIRKGPRSSNPSQLFVFNNKLYFSADDGNVGAELWSVASCLNLVVNTSGTIAGEAEGTIELIIQGGIAPYEITWSNGDSLAELSNLEAGIYTATVRDSSGCISSVTAEVESISKTNNSSVESFEISPNPASTLISIKTKIDAPLYLYNSTGVLLKEYDTTRQDRFEISISHLPKGLYLIKQGEITKWWTKM